jgi:carboxypeptidase family protein
LLFVSLLALALMAFLMISVIVSADTETPASLQGTVTDETGAGITVAAVVLENLDYTFIRRTDAQGQYRFPKVTPGTYTLTVHAEGFTRFSSQVQLVAGRPSVLNVVLKVFTAERKDPFSSRVSGATYSVVRLTNLAPCSIL